MDPVTGTIIVAVVAGLPATIAAMAALISSMRNSATLKDVARQTNGMREVIEAQARAAGFEAGRGAVRRGDIDPDWPEGGHPR